MAQYWRVDTIVPATGTIIDLPTFKQFARVDDSNSDNMLQGFLYAAQQEAEKYLNRILMTQTLQLTIAYTPVPQTYYSSAYMMGAWQTFYPGMPFSYNAPITLPYSPAQQITSVSQGYWNQYPDTFLTAGTDYFCDLASSPARIQIVTRQANAYGPDHVSIQYVAGYDQVNLLTIDGTATATDTLNLVVAGVAVAVTVNTGDTALTALTNAQAAIIATAGTPSAKVLTGTQLQLRGANTALTVGNVPAGLTVTASTPFSDIPAMVSQAILWGAKFMYQNVLCKH